MWEKEENQYEKYRIVEDPLKELEDIVSLTYISLFGSDLVKTFFSSPSWQLEPAQSDLSLLLRYA
jgi:hypothetical protein